MPPSPVAIGALMAGGEARRMGSDKRQLELNGTSLLARNLAFLQRIFPTVALSLRHTTQWPHPLPPEVIVVPDVLTGSPLAGIATLLQRFGEPVFVLAADTAFPEEGVVQQLLNAFRDADIAVPRLNGHHEPLSAVYGPGCLPFIEDLLARGRHRIGDLFPRVRTVEVPFTDGAPFFNVNTLEDWREAQRRLAESTPAAPQPPSGPAIVSFVGKSNSGKTTLIERLIPQLIALGLRVGAIKHDAHDFEIDYPGKDSWRHGRAGGTPYVIASPTRLALVAELPRELSLLEIVHAHFSAVDIVVVEGYKHTAPHRVEVFRAAAGHERPLLTPRESIALATDVHDLPHDHRFALDDAAGLAAFLAERLDLLREETERSSI